MRDPGPPLPRFRGVAKERGGKGKRAAPLMPGRRKSGIPYSQMRTGQWKILLQGRQLAVQRVLYLTVGTPETVVVTATPTVVVGITSTPAAISTQ